MFLIFGLNIDCGYSLEPPRPGSSNVYPQYMFLAKLLKISFFFQVKFSIFTSQKMSVYCLGMCIFLDYLRLMYCF